MSILVTGANGLVGRALCLELCRQHDVVAAVRTVDTEVNSLIQTATICSIDSNTDWSAALHNVDVVVHLAARVHVMNDTAVNPLTEFRKVNVEGALNLASQSARAGVKRFVFISSAKVNGEHTENDKPFTEADIPNPQDAYGISKLEAEQGLMLIAQQVDMEVVVIRPPLIYGAGVKANFASMMRVIKRAIPLPLGAIHNKRSFVYIDNLVSLIVQCIDHPAAANQIFLVSDGNDLSTTELLRGCASALGVKSRLVPISQKLIESFAALVGKENVAQRLCGNLQVDITKARTMLDWTPPITVEEGLRATAIGFNKVNV
jgi:nucleoside-diphosphate-sugar epimerase